LYVADATPNVIYQIDLAANVSVFAGIGGGPQTVAVDRAGSYGGLLYVATRAPDRMYSVSPSGQVQLFSNFPGSVPNGHVDLMFDPGSDYGGQMYAALARTTSGSGVGGLFSIDPGGSATVFAPAIESAVSAEIDPVGDFGGELFACGKLDSTDPAYTMIWRVAPDGAISEFAMGNIGSGMLSSLTFGPDGAMYVAEYSFDEQTALIQRVFALSPIEAAVDIKPGSCPNPLNLKSGGLLPVAILGSEELDVNDIDIASVRLVGVAPIRSNMTDVAGPVIDGIECDCDESGADGFVDLSLKFKKQDIVEALSLSDYELVQGAELTLDLAAALNDGTVIEGGDCVVIVGKVPNAIAAKKSDVNGDGMVDFLDFSKLAQHWMEPAL
jgi:hypothetical protein